MPQQKNSYWVGREIQKMLTLITYATKMWEGIPQRNNKLIQMGSREKRR